MRKLFVLFALFLGLTLSAQDTYYTIYSFVVEPQNEAAVYKLFNDYYSANKPEGVYVRLFENHFKDQDSKATHAVVFSGSREAVSKMYSGSGNVDFDLFIARLNPHIKDGAGSGMGRHLALFGDTSTRYPFQRYYLLDAADTDKFDAEFKKFHSKHIPPGMLMNMGTPMLGQGSGDFNRWVIQGYKDMNSAMGGAGSMVTGAAKTAREKAWDEYMASHGGVEIVGTGMRVLLGAW